MISAANYWRSRLPADGQRTYDSICSALGRGRSEARAYIKDNRGLSLVQQAILYDNPQYFWYPSRLKVTYRGEDMTAQFTPLYNRREIRAAMAEINAASAATRGNSEFETEKLIAEYLVKNVTYKINDKYNQNMAAAIYYKQAQCSGFASAVKYLCDVNGIWCIMVEGEICNEDNNGSHAWNIVRIDGKFYHLDVTAMAGSNTDKPPQIRYDYFNFSDNQIAKNHKWKINTVPRCPENFDRELPNADEEETCGIVYSNLAEMRTGIEQAMKNGENAHTFMLKVGDGIDEKHKLVMSGLKMVMQKVKYVGGVQVESLGEIITVKFNR